MKYRMLVSDLDNTLLNNKLLISPEVKEAIAYARENGVNVVLCSGRCYLSMLIFERALGPISDTQLGISFNGGLIYESLSQKALTDYRLDRGLAFELIDALKAKGASVLVYQGGDLYADSETQDVKDYHRGVLLPVVLLDDFSRLTGEISKVLIRGKKSFIEPLEQSLRDLAYGRCNTFFSADNLLEYCPAQANKGAGLEFVCQYLGISPEETIAVGDQNNDIPMLRAAGLGIAVANATDEAKAAADLVMGETNDQNAVAKIIYKYLT